MQSEQSIVLLMIARVSLKDTLLQLTVHFQRQKYRGNQIQPQAAGRVCRRSIIRCFIN